MGRTRTKSRKSLNSKSSLETSQVPNSPESTVTSSAPTVSSLVDKAKLLIEQCDYELALRFIQRVLHRQPAHGEARELLGVIQIETGEIGSAKETFMSLVPPSATALSPPPPSAYLYLAQLSDEDPLTALQYYQSAVDIFMGQLKGKERAINFPSAEDEAELKVNIVRALVGMVEIWMDPAYDLCFDPSAPQKCEDLLNRALQTDPGNGEALQALASVRMSQERPEDAKSCLEQAWGVWKDLEIDDPRLPPIPTRLALVRLLLELSMFTQALAVLQGVMAMDDQEVEAWYLEGWCFFLMAEQAKETGGKFDDLTWEELAKDARDCLETCQVLHTNEGHPDVPLLSHVRELILQLEKLGIKPSPAVEEAGADDGEWEDADSEDEDGDVDMQ